MKKIEWMSAPEEHDYPAAFSYLCLHYPPAAAHLLTEKLREAPINAFKAKDVFRASGLPLLGISNSHVNRNLDKIDHGKKLSPVLLVRGNPHLIVADGYHRICAVYTLDEDADIPCKVVG